MLIKSDSPFWPENLIETEKLYLEGNVDLLKTRGIAIVGTRHPSDKSIEITRRTVDILGSKGFTIISGLALGIDGVAHMEAIKMGFPTIAVIGTPINKCYPKEHEFLQKTIAEKGLVVSQFSPSEKVEKYFFIKRNQTMARIACASVIVEDRDGGGAVSQVKYSEKISKPVFVFRSAFDNDNLKWPKTLKNPNIVVDPERIPEQLESWLRMQKTEVQPSLF